jgi:P-type E1-E2 ATPase
MGVSAVVEGTEYFLGSRRMADTLAGGTETHPDPETDEDAAPLTSAWFGWDGAVHGTMAFGDRVRPDAVELCAGLRRQGISTLLLSGDSERSTRAVAASIGADQWIADADPNRKIEVIRELQQRGIAVAMVGDGVNDAPSLAQADLGIALGSGTDIAVQAAPLVLMNSSLHGVLYLLDLSRRTFRVVRQNLFWAFAYNAAGIALAAAGVLNPILAACAMVLSSLSVIGNSRRLS